MPNPDGDQFVTQALVIGGGPAGLMAAEVMAQAGLSVTIADAMPSLGRKFLMAGKSGLNLTKAEPDLRFRAAYPAMPKPLALALDDFGPDAVMGWARGLGQEIFVGSTGRVFPTVMKASPLLRAWLARLGDLGVTVQTRWRWLGWQGQQAVFDTAEGQRLIEPDVTVLALGGASWARLGSDGAWQQQMQGKVAAFAPSNFGLQVAWSSHMHKFFGQPLKAVTFACGALRSKGEAIISARGLEGGGIYALSAALRAGDPLRVDLLPDRTPDQLRNALAAPKGKASLSNHLRKRLRLDPLRLALLAEFGRPYPDDLAPLLKALPIAHGGPRPLDEAISTAGGLRFDALNAGLMLRDRPGVFCAGEMLDWDAPTGGYLLTASFATGRLAGKSAIAYACG